MENPSGDRGVRSPPRAQVARDAGRSARPQPRRDRRRDAGLLAAATLIHLLWLPLTPWSRAGEADRPVPFGLDGVTERMPLPEPNWKTGAPPTPPVGRRPAPRGRPRGSATAPAPAFAVGDDADPLDRPFRIGGHVQFDTTAFGATAGPMHPIDQAGLAPPLTDAVNFRRARLRFDGRMAEPYDWAAEYDFVNQINTFNQIDPLWPSLGPLPQVTELWLQARDMPLLGTLRAGNQKDPFGYEHLANCRTLDLMERSFCQDAFVGPFNDGFVPGIQAMSGTPDGRVAWQLGEFANTQAPFGFTDFAGGSMTTGRLVWVPTWEEGGRSALHLGLSGRTFQPRNGLVRFRSRGALWNGPPGPDNAIYADSGVLAGAWQNMLAAEIVAGDGPWSLQAEYMGSWLLDASTTAIGPLSTAGFQPPPGTPVGTVFYQGAYVEAARFLTGEQRVYSLAEHRFGRPLPERILSFAPGRPRGFGAWQAVARYNWLCLDDGEVQGGVLNGATVGLNWLLTPRARILFNYDVTWRQYRSTPWANGPAGPQPVPSYDGSGTIHGFGTRLGFDF